jgi:hypothetical protein
MDRPHETEKRSAPDSDENENNAGKARRVKTEEPLYGYVLLRGDADIDILVIEFDKELVGKLNAWESRSVSEILDVETVCAALEPVIKKEGHKLTGGLRIAQMWIVNVE